MKKFKLRTRSEEKIVQCADVLSFNEEVKALHSPSTAAKEFRLLREVQEVWAGKVGVASVLGCWHNIDRRVDCDVDRAVECTKLSDGADVAEIPQESEPIVNAKAAMQLPSADSLLHRAADIMAERGKQYDSTGQNKERSMGRIVAAFNALYGTSLTEQQGWHFMLLVKLARQQTRPHADSMEDAIAYAALAGEAGFASLAVDASSKNSVAEPQISQAYLQSQIAELYSDYQKLEEERDGLREAVNSLTR